MERSLSSLAFKGSVAEAISDAKQQKKLFVVYISGDNSGSRHLETSTWLDSQVAESLSKYCILLHIAEGSSHAINFAALYPQKAVPCITAVGFNGKLLWQHEGFVAADVLAFSLQKAWETMIAALGPKAELPPEISSSVSSEQRSSLRENIELPLLSEAESVSHTVRPTMYSQTTVKEAEASLEARPSNDSQVAVKEAEASVEARPTMYSKTKVMEINSVPVDTLSPGLASGGQYGSGGSNNSAVPVAKVEKSPDVGGDATGNSKERSLLLTNKSNLSAQPLVLDNEVFKDSSSKATEAEKTNVSDPSMDVHLNIKLPDCSSLQVKLLATDTLRAVKGHIDREQDIGFSYDLAVPYPRKVFDDQDLDKTLSELSLLNRQALIVVLRHKGKSPLQDQNALPDKTGATSGNTEGYFSFVRRLFSYLNPFSFLGGGASSADDAHISQSGMSQNGNDRPYGVSPSNELTPGTSSSSTRSRNRSASHFGSNIHTLKHDDDDSPFGDGNAFWNGNSTQFGGSENK
ncbi:unnamed protein product [Cuscuta epithymum]|uniref:UBX domain-containing protein n=1 Tax=Cuscuta epithymum TaxID=186058 RepID=A0AAV0FMB6_9ASTE|nr:unnamed protein product [Cuscuta epithymum]